MLRSQQEQLLKLLRDHGSLSSAELWGGRCPFLGRPSTSPDGRALCSLTHRANDVIRIAARYALLVLFASSPCFAHLSTTSTA